MGLLHRLAAVLLCLALSGANVGVFCAGWLTTPEARMACCAEGGSCPMHARNSHGSGSGTVVTQVEADSCCLSSEHETSSTSSTPTFVAAISAVPGPGIVLPASVPALVLSDDWRTASPIPAAPIPRYVLLSVFLV